MRLTIVAFGRPAPQGSKQQGGAGQLREQSAYLNAWRAAVKLGAYEAYKQYGINPAALPVFPAGSAVYVESCTFYVLADQCRAQGTDDPVGTPDIDKLLRAVLDALGGGRHSARLFADDSQVVGISGLRKLRPAGTQGGLIMTVSDEPERD